MYCIGKSEEPRKLIRACQQGCRKDKQTVTLGIRTARLAVQILCAEQSRKRRDRTVIKFAF